MLSKKLIAACVEGQLSVVEDLVKASINVNAVDEQGHTCLYWAGFAGEEPICSYLVKQAGYDLNLRNPPEGDNALHLMARYNMNALVRHLVEDKKMDVTIKNSYGETARDVSIKCGRSPNFIAQFLQKAESLLESEPGSASVLTIDTKHSSSSSSSPFHDSDSKLSPSKADSVSPPHSGGSGGGGSGKGSGSSSVSPFSSPTTVKTDDPAQAERLRLLREKLRDKMTVRLSTASVTSSSGSGGGSGGTAASSSTAANIAASIAAALATAQRFPPSYPSSSSSSSSSSSAAAVIVSPPSTPPHVPMTAVVKPPTGPSPAERLKIARQKKLQRMIEEETKAAQKAILVEQLAIKRAKAEKERQKREELEARAKENEKLRRKLELQKEFESAKRDALLMAKRDEEFRKLQAAKEKMGRDMEAIRRQRLKENDDARNAIKKHKMDLEGLNKAEVEFDEAEIEALAAQELVAEFDEDKRPSKNIEVRKSAPCWNEPLNTCTFWQKVENAIVHTYSLNEDGELQERTDRHRVRMHIHPFSNGMMRYAYFGQDLDIVPPRNLVFKESKYLETEYNSANWFIRDINCSVKARDYAEKFNAEAGINKAVDYAPVWLYEFPDRKNPKSKTFSAEPFLDGHWERYSNNGRYLIPATHSNKWHTLFAFSHYSYVKSGQTEMVVDLQGVDYVLTDPQIHSKARAKYGEGDRGQSGFDDFFDVHVCNAICERLGLPRQPGKISPIAPLATTQFAKGNTKGVFKCGHVQSLDTVDLRNRITNDERVMCNQCKANAEKEKKKQTCVVCTNSFTWSKTENAALGIASPSKFCSGCDSGLNPVIST